MPVVCRYTGTYTIGAAPQAPFAYYFRCVPSALKCTSLIRRGTMCRLVGVEFKCEFDFAGLISSSLVQAVKSLQRMNNASRFFSF